MAVHAERRLEVHLVQNTLLIDASRSDRAQSGRGQHAILSRDQRRHVGHEVVQVVGGIGGCVHGVLLM